MDKIKICCTGSKNISLDELIIYPGNLKKHSLLEVERLCDSIENDGFLFPIAVSKLNNKNYIVDGECRFLALIELESRGYEIPEVPIFYVRANEQNIKRNILLATSTNHCVTETSLKIFAEGTNINLKQLGFNTADLIDFHNDTDIGLYVYTNGGKYNKEEINSEDFEGLLK